MPFHVKDPATDRAVRRLAKLKGKSLTAAIREAVEHEYEREHRRVPLVQRLAVIQDHLDAIAGPNPLPADKAFYDDLSGDA
jgi:antitoxin VapB